MITCLFSICANRILIDPATNKASAIDIVNKLDSQSFPLVLPAIYCLFFLERSANDPAQHSLEISVKLGDKEIFSAPVDVDFGAGLTARSIIKFDGFIVPGPGVLTFSLLTEAKSVGKIVVLANKIDIDLPRFSSIPS
ncbi:MAG: hypothetical protein GY862_21375 [Gammaproteobacteria bacterium]|nr:hypothetical protein [Gammaproteobacteria bacterium]